MPEGQDRGHKEVREDLRKCFRDVKCFLMPNPGPKVQQRDFDGRLIRE